MNLMTFISDTLVFTVLMGLIFQMSLVSNFSQPQDTHRINLLFFTAGRPNTVVLPQLYYIIQDVFLWLAANMLKYSRL